MHLPPSGGCRRLETFIASAGRPVPAFSLQQQQQRKRAMGRALAHVGTLADCAVILRDIWLTEAFVARSSNICRSESRLNFGIMWQLVLPVQPNSGCNYCLSLRWGHLAGRRYLVMT